MLVIVDDMILWLLLGLAMMFMGAFGVLVIVLLKCPGAARAVISAWMFKKILTIEATLDRGFKFIPRKALPGGQLVANVDGKKSVKVIASNPEPSLACPCHLDGSGVKALLCFEPSTVAVSPAYVAAMQVVSSSEPESLPVQVQEWAKSVNIDGERLLGLVKKEEVKEKDVVSVSKLLPISLEKIQRFFAFAYREDAYRNMLENEWIDGNRNRGHKAFGMKGIVGVIIVVVAVGVILFLVSSGMIK